MTSALGPRNRIVISRCEVRWDRGKVGRKETRERQLSATINWIRGETWENGGLSHVWGGSVAQRSIPIAQRKYSIRKMWYHRQMYKKLAMEIARTHGSLWQDSLKSAFSLGQRYILSSFVFYASKTSQMLFNRCLISHIYLITTTLQNILGVSKLKVGRGHKSSKVREQWQTLKGTVMCGIKNENEKTRHMFHLWGRLSNNAETAAFGPVGDKISEVFFYPFSIIKEQREVVQTPRLITCIISRIGPWNFALQKPSSTSERKTVRATRPSSSPGTGSLGNRISAYMTVFTEAPDYLGWRTGVTWETQSEWQGVVFPLSVSTCMAPNYFNIGVF